MGPWTGGWLVVRRTLVSSFMGPATKNAPPGAERFDLPIQGSTRRLVPLRHNASRRNRDPEYSARAVRPYLAVGSARIRDGDLLRLDRRPADRDVLGARRADAHGDLGIPTGNDHRYGTVRFLRNEIILVKDVIVDDQRAWRYDELVGRLAPRGLHVSADAAAPDHATHALAHVRPVLDLDHVLRGHAVLVGAHLRQHSAVVVGDRRGRDDLATARAGRAANPEVLTPNALAPDRDGEAPLVERRDLTRHWGCETDESQPDERERSHGHNIHRASNPVL